MQWSRTFQLGQGKADRDGDGEGEEEHDGCNGSFHDDRCEGEVD